MDGASNSAREISVGPFTVVADARGLGGFVDVTRSNPSTVPALYPLVWLARPEVRSAIAACLAPDEIPVHEEQSIAIDRPIVRGKTYRLDVVLSRQGPPARLSIRSTIVGDDAEPVASMSTVLRLVAIAQTPHRSDAGGAQQ